MHHLARADGHISSRLERFGPGRPLPAGGTPQILEVVEDAARQALATGGLGAAQGHGVGGEEIRWRNRVEQLPGRERDDVLVLAAYAADAGHGRLPPALDCEK